MMHERFSHANFIRAILQKICITFNFCGNYIRNNGYYAVVVKKRGKRSRNFHIYFLFDF